MVQWTRLRAMRFNARNIITDRASNCRKKKQLKHDSMQTHQYTWAAYTQKYRISSKIGSARLNARNNNFWIQSATGTKILDREKAFERFCNLIIKEKVKRGTSNHLLANTDRGRFKSSRKFQPPFFLGQKLLTHFSSASVPAQNVLVMTIKHIHVVDIFESDLHLVQGLIIRRTSWKPQ